MITSAAPSQQEEHFWLNRLKMPVFFFLIALTLVGAYAALQVPIAVFPSTNFPRILISIDNGVMPVEQMQVTITRPIEDAVNSVPGLHLVRSTTSRGSAEVDLFFDWNTDMWLTLELVNGAISRVQQELPSSVRISTTRLTFSSFPILGYALVTDPSAPKNLTQSDLWEIATYELKPPLNRVDGVSSVLVQGGQVPEFHILPNMAALAADGITISDIVNGVDASNIIDSPGLYEDHHELILGLVGSQAHSVDDLKNLVLKTTPAGVPIHISDVAQVVKAPMPIYTIVTANGKPSVLLSINRQLNSNTVKVADHVAVEIAALQKKLPQGVHLVPYYDQSGLVRDSIASVRDAILIGLLLACVVLYLFLRDWSSSIVAGLVIPVTVAVTILFLWIIGQTFNLMTLGGLAAAIGLVIDDAIVVVEAIVVHRDRGESRIEAVRRTFHEITIPLIGSTITPVVVFVPLIAVSGVTGTFFRALAVTMTAALLTSLLLALTWTPALSLVLLRSHRNTPPAEAPAETTAASATVEGTEHVGPLLRKILALHTRALHWVLRRPLALGGICLLIVLGGYLSYSHLGSDLLPQMDEGGFILDYVTPSGSSLTETNRMLEQVEAILQSTPEVAITSRRTGLQLGLAAVTEANHGDFSVKLKSHRSRSIYAIMDDVRQQIRTRIPALDVEFTQVLQDNIGDLSNSPEPIQVKLFCTDLNLLIQLGPKVEKTIAAIPGVVDTENGIDNTVSGPATNFQVSPVLASHYGFTPAEVIADSTAIMDGLPAANPIINNDRPYTVRVRLPQANRASLDAIRNTVFNSASAHTATLGSLTQITELPPQNEIYRENLQQLVVVTGRLEGSDLGGTMVKVQQAVNAMHLPPNVRVEYGGTYQEQQKSFAELLRVLVLALVLVFGVLLLEFRNFSAPTAILTSSLLSVAGVLFALLITGTTFNVASFMAVIMVIGIVAKNGILLLDADEKFRSQGVAPEEAMIEAAQRRLRPILMTAIAAICGMLPLAFAIGSGSQMLQPLAIGVIGGLSVSVALSVFVTPAVYYWLTRHSADHTPAQG